MDMRQFDMVIMQLEMPLETVYRTYELAKTRGIPVFLDAGPAMSIPLKRLEGLLFCPPMRQRQRLLPVSILRRRIKP